MHNESYRLVYESQPSACFILFFPRHREDILLHLVRLSGWSAGDVEGMIVFTLPANYMTGFQLDELVEQQACFEVTAPARQTLDDLINLPGLFEI